MKVGDYVRTKYYGISKILDISNETTTNYCSVKLDRIDDFGSLGVYVYRENIIKSSPNIIDLIEVGDYVNGQKVFDKLYDELNKCWYLKLEIGEVFGKYARTYQQHIKSIVTKEQFEAMEYKVEV